MADRDAAERTAAEAAFFASIRQRERRQQRQQNHPFGGSPERQRAGVQCYRLLGRAKTNDRTPPEGRLALLREARDLAVRAEPPNWGEPPERRRDLAALDAILQAAETAAAAPDLESLQQALRPVPHHLFDRHLALRRAYKALRRIAELRAWALLRDTQ